MLTTDVKLINFLCPLEQGNKNWSFKLIFISSHTMNVLKGPVEAEIDQLVKYCTFMKKLYLKAK